MTASTSNCEKVRTATATANVSQVVIYRILYTFEWHSDDQHRVRENWIGWLDYTTLDRRTLPLTSTISDLVVLEAACSASIQTTISLGECPGIVTATATSNSTGDRSRIDLLTAQLRTRDSVGSHSTNPGGWGVDRGAWDERNRGDSSVLKAQVHPGYEREVRS